MPSTGKNLEHTLQTIHGLIGMPQVPPMLIHH
jgi:hypothetical protein